MSTIRQAALNGGEIAPELYGRTDHPRYVSGVRKLLNFIATPHGAAKNRPGSKLVAKVKDSTVKPRLIPFVFSTTQTYVLEFGNLYLRFHQAGGQVVSLGVPYEIATPFTTAMLPYLRFAQAGDTITICYGGQEPGGTAAIAPQELRRLGHTNWTIGAASFTPQVVASYDAGPPALGLVNPGNQPTSTAPARPFCWAVTQLWKENATGNVFETFTGYIVPQKAWDSITTFGLGEMVYDGSFDAIYTSKQAANLNHVTSDTTWWTKGVVAAAGLPIQLRIKPGTKTGFTFVGTKIFRGTSSGGTLSLISGPFGLIAVLDANATQFQDEGTTAPDYTQQPPLSTQPFDIPAGGHDYPAAVCFFEQRRLFGRQVLHSARIQGSRIGQIANFDVDLIVQADDAVSFDLSSLTLDEIRGLVPLQAIFAFTQSGVWTVRGYQGNALSPTSINARKQEHAVGASWVTPARAGNSIIYEQDGGGALHEFAYDAIYDVGRSTDLSIWASHFFEGHTIASLAYAARPNKIIWVVRDDGLLLGVTYLRSLDPSQGSISAWHQHTTDGLFEDVCVVPEGTEDAVYVLVNRTIGGAVQRTVERFATRLVPDARLGVFLDSALSYDGRNTGAVTMQASGATYNGGNEVTILASAPTFVADDVGSAIVEDPNAVAGGPFRMTILAYTDATHVTAKLEANLGAAFQNVATTSWGFARRRFTGIGHLEGKTVAALADGGVATASKPDSSLTVTAGQITIDEPAVIVTAGLPYVSDLELLDLPTAKLNVRSIQRAALEVVASRGMWAGESFAKLKESRQRQVPDAWGNPGAATGIIEVIPNSTWNQGGRAAFRMVDPLPLTVVAAIREVIGGGN